MSLKELFSKEGRKERALRKNCDKARNKKIKPDDRQPALYALYEEAVALGEARRAVENDPDDADLGAALEIQERHAKIAMAGMLSRFTFIYDTNMVRDEEEKGNVEQWLVALATGDLAQDVLQQIKKHLRSAPTLSWGLKLVRDVYDHDTVWEVLSEVLEDFDPEYERDPSRKIQLMTFLGDFDDPRSVEALLPFLEDHDETVRYLVAESLFKHGDERAREPLLKLMCAEDEESLRIKAAITEGFMESGWRVKGFRGTVEKLLASQLPDYIVDGKSRIKTKKLRK